VTAILITLPITCNLLKFENLNEGHVLHFVAMFITTDTFIVIIECFFTLTTFFGLNFFRQEFYCFVKTLSRVSMSK